MSKKAKPTINDLVKMANDCGMAATIELAPRQRKSLPHTREIAMEAVKRVKKGPCTPDSRDVQILLDIAEYFIEASKH